jgi:hypothetical protein
MPESFVQVAADGGGKKLRTRQRTVGANTIEEQHVISSQSEAVPINRVWFSTLRIPGRAIAAAATQPMLSIWNGIASGGNNVSIRRLTVEIDAIGVYATTAPILRLFRTTAAATGGTVITPVQQYTADTAFSTSVAIRADHQADNVVATTPLAQTGLATQPMWSQLVPKSYTAAGYHNQPELNMLPNDSNLIAVDPGILRPQEGVHVQLTMGGTASTAANNWVYVFKAVLAEFTYP